MSNIWPHKLVYDDYYYINYIYDLGLPSSMGLQRSHLLPSSRAGPGDGGGGGATGAGGGGGEAEAFL